MTSEITLPFYNSYAALPGYFYTKQRGEGFGQPYLVHFNPQAAALIGMEAEAARHPRFAQYFSGNLLLPGSDPLAMVYAGHQFGVYVPQLGDGRALLLGQVRNGEGEMWDIQLKGSGKTPYSRFGDGRAVLRSSIREYLCSEAMHGLGIPTTRALCIVGTNEPVLRETVEPGAVMTRLSPSHIRFGHFEFFHYTGQYRAVRELADCVITEHFPTAGGKAATYARWLEEVIRRTARLMAQWQAAGFAHGVMNTDNMSVLGLTIDYGPFGFMEAFDPEFVCNHSDTSGRYAFDQQPYIGLWNLHAFANAVSTLVPPEESKPLLDRYSASFGEAYRARMRRKLGLMTEREEDTELLIALLALLQRKAVDYTSFFRTLSRYPASEDHLDALFEDHGEWQEWKVRYDARLRREEAHDDETRQMQMLRTNPKYVLRNWIAEQAIRRAEDEKDYSEIGRVLKVMQAPFDEHAEAEELAAPAPAWAKELCVSCSS